MNISCIIIDDEPNAVVLLERYIRKIPILDLKGSFFDPLEALEFLKKQPVDVIITDINMPLLSGLELAEVLSEKQAFIFTTAYAEHALTSFNHNVIDFILKPISFKRFIKAAEKVEYQFKDFINRQFPSKLLEQLMFAKSGKQIIKINFQDVEYIKGEKEYVGIHSKNEQFLIYKRMKDMEALLPENFKRIHTSYIINVHCIKKVEFNTVFIGDVKIPIGMQFKETFFKFINPKII